MKTIFYLTLTGGLLMACQSGHTTSQSRQSETTLVAEQTCIQPIVGLEIPKRTFEIDNRKESNVQLPNGGSLVFPAHAFVDEFGKPINGIVTIEWQEFHSLTDILLSGIPMKYDSLDAAYDFVSGGMFTIDAKQGETPVDLGNGKEAVVNLASYDDTPCFNFYTLNDQTGTWSYDTTATAQPMKTENESVVVPKKPSKVLDVVVDYSHIESLQGQDVLGWEPLNPISKTEVIQIYDAGNHVQLKEADSYFALILASAHGRVEIPVKPYTLAQANMQREALEEREEKQLDQLLAYQNNLSQGIVVRSIAIPGMGTYNWDKVLTREREVQFASIYQFPTEESADFMQVFFVSPSENVIIVCGKTGDQKFKCDANKANYLVAINQHNEVFYVDAEAFKSAQQKAKGTVVFQFENSGLTAHHPSDVGTILQELMTNKS